ncbi:MAG: hypothetical protein ABWW70_06140 [Thermoproteota archaeon]
MSSRIVAVRLPDEVYRKLEEIARRRGYLLVSDLVREILTRAAEAGGEPAGGQLDSKALLKALEESGVLQELSRMPARLERRLQDAVNPWTAKVDMILSRLAELSEKVEALEQELAGLKKDVEELKQARESAPPAYEKPERREARPRRRSAIERLREQGVVFERELTWLRDRDAFFDRLEREGAVVFEIGGERVAVDPEFWENFKEKVKQLPTANDDEIRVLLTEQQYELFQRLKENAMVFYNSTTRSWRFVPELEKLGGRASEPGHSSE